MCKYTEKSVKFKEKSAQNKKVGIVYVALLC